MFCVFAAWRGSWTFWHERDQCLEEGLHRKEHCGVHPGRWDWAHPPWPHGKLCECVGIVLWMWSRARLVLENAWKSWSFDSLAVFRALTGLKVGENLKHRVLGGLWKLKVLLCKFCCWCWLLYVYVLLFFLSFFFMCIIYVLHWIIMRLIWIFIDLQIHVTLMVCFEANFLLRAIKCHLVLS